MRSIKMLIGGVTLAMAGLHGSVACAQWGQFGVFGYTGGFGGGKLEGNYLQGMSQVIRAEGEYNYNTAQAGISFEEARSKYLDNQKKWSQNLFQMREERQRLAIQQREINKQSNETRAAALAAKPPVYHGLGRNALDPVTGRLIWPQVLRGPEFDDARKEIDQLFELRAKTSQGAAMSDKIHETVQEMTMRLRSQIEKTPANQYMAAHKFLTALDYTTRHEMM